LLPLSCVLTTLKSLEVEGAQAHAISRYIEVAAPVMRIAAVPHLILLFTVVAWSVSGRALERYLLHIKRVTRLVPRRSFADAFWARLRRDAANS
jgi:hypothetical protein